MPCPSTPQQNGVAERKNLHLLDVVRTLLLESHVSSRFWCEALSIVVHLINRMSFPPIGNESPFTRLYGHPQNYSTLRVFSCVCYVHLPPKECTKLAAQSVECAFLGYSPHQKGFLCYDPNLRRIRVSRNVIFQENKYFFASHHDLVSSLVSILPLFSNSHSRQQPSKPLLTYKRRSTATHGAPQDNSLVAGPVEEPEPRSLRESKPPKRYINCMTTSLSSIPIPSSNKHAVENDCW